MSNANFLPEGYQAPKCPIIQKYEQTERGNRSHFVRLGITMDPEMIRHLKTVGLELQAKGYPDTDLSSLVRCACKEFLRQVEEFLAEKQQDKWCDEMNNLTAATEDAIHEKQHNEWIDKMNSN